MSFKGRLEVGSKVEVHCKTRDKWETAVVVEVFEDDKGKQKIKIKYENIKRSKNIRMSSSNMRSITRKKRAPSAVLKKAKNPRIGAQTERTSMHQNSAQTKMRHYCNTRRAVFPFSTHSIGQVVPHFDVTS